jgi:hypothetical protein
MDFFLFAQTSNAEQTRSHRSLIAVPVLRRTGYLCCAGQDSVNRDVHLTCRQMSEGIASIGLMIKTLRSRRRRTCKVCNPPLFAFIENRPLDKATYHTNAKVRFWELFTSASETEA